MMEEPLNTQCCPETIEAVPVCKLFWLVNVLVEVHLRSMAYARDLLMLLANIVVLIN